MVALSALLVAPVWAEDVEVTRTTTITTIMETEVKAQRKPRAYRTMIVVEVPNDLKEFHKEAYKFEDEVSASLSTDILRIISREDVLKAGKLYGVGESGTGVTATDQNTIRSSSDVNMASALGADLVLKVILGSATVNPVIFRGKADGFDGRVRGTYRILDGGARGEAIVSGRFDQRLSSSEETRQEAIAVLLEKAADAIAKEIEKEKAKIAAVEVSKVPLFISCRPQDMQWKGLTVPSFYRTEDGKVRAVDAPLDSELVAEVQLNGFVVGTTPCTIMVWPGNHNVLVKSPGFVDGNRNILVPENGLSLDFPLSMSPAGLSRWKDMQAFTAQLGKDKKLLERYLAKDETLEEGELAVLHGLAEMYGNSYFQITELPVVVTPGAPMTNVKVNLYNELQNIAK